LDDDEEDDVEDLNVGDTRILEVFRKFSDFVFVFVSVIRVFFLFLLVFPGFVLIDGIFVS
jgi:hypothetical protein